MRIAKKGRADRIGVESGKAAEAAPRAKNGQSASGPFPAAY